MKRHSQWIIAGTVLWLSACSTLPRPVGPDNEIRRQAAVQTRWIGVPKKWTGKCPGHPSISDWRVRPLVPLEELEPSLKKSVQKAKLDRFCVYEYKGAGRVTRDLRPPRKILAQLRSVEPDRLALSSMSTLQDATSPKFSPRFFEQVQSLTPLPSGATGRVRLVFLDTQPTGEGIPGGTPKSRHGYTLGHIAGRLAGYPNCVNGCAVDLASRLALPVVSFNPATGQEFLRDDTFGGFRGTFTDLVHAIVSEVDHWMEENNDLPPGTPHSRLVLNLSVGWDGEKFGGWQELPADMPLGPQAVYGAVKAAAEQEVLLIAAAGNDRGGPTPTGQPLLPGGWEKPYRLTKPNNAWVWKNIGTPLIYAASGIDGFGRQLVNTRRQGEAPRVTYADHVAVEDLNSSPPSYTATLTGTSVASAVISTTAAIVWSYQPVQLPKDVMATLDSSGTNPLNRDHDFADILNPQKVQRITLCRALKAVLPINCGNIPAPAPINLSLTFPSPVDLDPLLQPLPTNFRPHPDTQDQALCGPQPGVNPCPNCVVDPPNLNLLASNEIAGGADSSLYQSLLSTNDHRLLIELPPSEWGVLKGATLEIFEFDPFGRRETTPDGRSISLQGQGNMEVTFSAPTGSFQAALTFTLAPDANALPSSYLSVVNPLFVDVP